MDLKLVKRVINEAFEIHWSREKGNFEKLNKIRPSGQKLLGDRVEQRQGSSSIESAELQALDVSH